MPQRKLKMILFHFLFLVFFFKVVPYFGEGCGEGVVVVSFVVGVCYLVLVFIHFMIMHSR